MKRFCAHRGVSALMPENTLPSFAAALALGADEIEFDVWETKDGKMIVSHDRQVDRISNGKGAVRDFTLEELKALSVGGEKGWELSYCTPEEVFEQLANRIVFNIHFKECGADGWMVKAVAELVKRYDAYGSVYFAASPDELAWIKSLAPEIQRTAIQLPHDKIDIFEMAETYDCNRVQLILGMFDRETVEKLHEMGIICNLFWADTEEDYTKYFDMGIDTLLTNRMDLAAKYKKSNQWLAFCE